MDSILNSIKKMLGIPTEIDSFDADVVFHINTVLSILNQLGVGPATGFSITGPDETWEEFMGEDKRYDMVKNYVFMRVKMLFDPPTSSFVTDATERIIKEIEWRIILNGDIKK